MTTVPPLNATLWTLESHQSAQPGNHFLFPDSTLRVYRGLTASTLYEHVETGSHFHVQLDYEGAAPLCINAGIWYDDECVNHLRKSSSTQGSDESPQCHHDYDSDDPNEEEHWPDGDPCNGDEVLFYRNFKESAFTVADSEADTDFVYLTIPGVMVADDAEATQDDSKGLLIKNPVYQARYAGIADHVKYLAITRQTFPVPGRAVPGEPYVPSHYDDCEVYYEAKVAFEGLNLEAVLDKYGDGIANIEDDIRVSAGSINLIDPVTGMVFDFMISNRRIYALYEHLPQNDLTDVFTMAKAVGQIRPGDRVTLRIGYNRHRQTVTWYLEGNPVYQVVRPGYPPADSSLLMTNGQEVMPRDLFSTDLVVGFGLFTLLDFFPADESYHEVGQEHTIGSQESTTTTIRRVRALANLGGVYNRKLPNREGEKIPLTQEDFVHWNDTLPPTEVDGQGGALLVKYVKVGMRTL